MVFYFSGTGNSKHVAQRLAQATGESCISITDCMSKDECEHMIYEVVMEPRESQFVDKPHDDVGQPPEIHGGDKSHTFSSDFEGK